MLSIGVYISDDDTDGKRSQQSRQIAVSDDKLRVAGVVDVAAAVAMPGV
jgi:hypothetical protein